MIVIKYPSHTAISDDFEEIRKRVNKLIEKFSTYAETPTREKALEAIKNTFEVIRDMEMFGTRIAYCDLITDELKRMYNNIFYENDYNTQEYLASTIQFCEYLCRAIANGKQRKRVL